MGHTVTGPFASTGREVYIAEAVRTPTGKSHPERGWYRDIHPNAMLAACYSELIARSGIEPALVEDLVIGCTAPFGEQSRNIARNAWLQAGYPPEVPATTLDRRCGSAQTAVEMAAALVASGTHDVVIAGGVEHMGHVPIDSPGKVVRTVRRPLARRAARPLRLRAPGRKRRADRRPLAAGPRGDGRLRRAFAPERRQGDRRRPIRRRDGADRRSTASSATPTNACARRPPWRRWPTSSRCSAKRTGESPPGRPRRSATAPPRCCCAPGTPRAGSDYESRARVVDQTTVGVDPIIMLTGPIPATRKLLQRNNLSIDDIDLFEVNEAFSSVVLAWQRELNPDIDRVNVNGGAIALGHAVGATGARLIATLVAELERREADLGLVTMCCGGGLGTGTLIQRVPT